MKLLKLLLCMVIIFWMGCDKNVTETDPPDQPGTSSVNRITLNRHPVDTDFNGIHSIVLVDLDGDGDLDIVGGSEITPNTASLGIAWWRNEGGNPPQWRRFNVDVNFKHVMSVSVSDINGDAFPDIVATSWERHEIAWWENSGNPNTGWKKRTIHSNFFQAHDAHGCDVNRDGHTDVIGIGSGGEVAVFCHQGTPVPSWDVQILSQSFAGGKSIFIEDLDHDGDPDFLGTAADANQTVWWENTGGNPVIWEPHTVTSNFNGSSHIDVADLNGDGLLDIIGSSWKINQVAVWICRNLPGNQWEKSVVSSRLMVAASVKAVDMDSDGDKDIVAVGHTPGEVVVLFNDDFSWVTQTVQTDFYGGRALAVLDFDGDGDLDIFAGASFHGELYWWENRGPSN